MQQTVNVILTLVNRFSGPASSAGSAITGLLGKMAMLNQALELVTRAARAVVGGFQAMTSGLIGAVAKFKNTQIQIAGTLTAFDLAPTMAEAKKASGELYDLLEKMAEPLPGSVDDFVDVFQRALPKSIEAFAAKGGSSLKDIAEFTSKFTAVAIANNVEAIRVAEDLPRLLGGFAGSDIVSFQKMQGLFAKTAKDLGLLAKGASFSTEAFNKMAIEKRLQILQEVVARSGATIDEYGKTTDAAEGTLESVIAKIRRIAGDPVYKAYAAGMGRVMQILDRYAPLIARVAELVGTTLARGFDVAARAAEAMINVIGSIPLLQDLKDIFLGGGVGGIGSILTFAGDAMLAHFRSALDIVGGLFTLLAPILGALLVPLAFLETQFRVAMAIIGAFISTLADLALPVIGYVFSRIQVFFERLRPVFAEVIEAATRVGTALATLLSPIVNIVMLSLGPLVDVLTAWVIPGF